MTVVFIGFWIPVPFSGAFNFHIKTYYKTLITSPAANSPHPYQV